MFSTSRLSCRPPRAYITAATAAVQCQPWFISRLLGGRRQKGKQHPPRKVDMKNTHRQRGGMSARFCFQPFFLIFYLDFALHPLCRSNRKDGCRFLFSVYPWFQPSSLPCRLNHLTISLPCRINNSNHHRFLAAACTPFSFYIYLSFRHTHF